MNRKSIILISFLLFSLCYIQRICAAPVTDARALEIAQSITGDDYNTYNYYVKRCIHLFHSNLSAPAASNATCVFVDMDPESGWEHDCAYVFISDGGRVEINYAKLPPSDAGYRVLYLNTRRHHDNTTISIPYDSQDDASFIEAANRTYAVIINGGQSANANDVRYWNNCSLIYQALVNHYNIPKSHIKVLMSDGTSTEPDMSYGYYDEVYDSPHDLDGDGIDDIQYAATKTNISHVFDSLAITVPEDGHLFIFTTGHGRRDNVLERSELYLWNNETLTPDELETEIEKVNAQCVNIVMGQCYSGGFIPTLSGNGRVIATACMENETSHAHRTLNYSEFLFHWINSVAGINGDNGNTVDADTNGDGFVTMDEAFEYADANDTRKNPGRFGLPETPQLNSETQSVKEDLAFNRIPQAVDLYIRDADDDTGKEPYISSSTAWNSPDIWIRRQNDGLENRENQSIRFSNEADEVDIYVYVKISNRGTKDYNYRHMLNYIHLYLTDATCNIGPNHFSGAECTFRKKDQKPIRTNIAAGDSIVVMFHMITDTADLFEGAVGNSISFSALAILSDESTLSLFDTEIDTSEFIRQRYLSNNIAIRNERVMMYLNNEPVPMSFEDINHACMISFESSNPLLTDLLTLDTSNYNIETLTSHYGQEYPSYQSMINLAGIERINGLHKKVGADAEIYFNINTSDAVIFNQLSDTETLKVIQTDMNTGNVIGGIDIVFKKEDSDAIDITSHSAFEHIQLDEQNKASITLTESMQSGHINVSSSNPIVQSIGRDIEENTTEVELNIPTSMNGVLIFDLIENNKIIDTKKIFK